MNKIAVIDIGSNSVRLMTIADGKVLYKTLITTQLGEGIAFSPRLKQTAMARTVCALQEFCARARGEGVEKVYAFATAAVRSAENGAEFVNLAYNECGLKIEVLSGEEEAEIGLLGALQGNDGAILDIGGASTELIVRDNGKIVYEKSLDIGVVRIKDLCGRNRQETRELAKSFAEKFELEHLNVPVYAIGGTATTLTAISLGLPVYEGKRVTGAKISKQRVQELADKLFSLTVEEISKIPCVDGLRAEVIAGGAEWLFAVMERFKLQEVIASDGDNLEGYAISRGFIRF